MESTETKKSIRRNLATDALQECEQKFRILLETIKEGVTIHDRFKIINANQAYAAMFGCGHHEMIGRDVLEFADSQSRDLIMDNLLKGDETPLKITAFKKDGSTFAVEVCSRIIPRRGNNLHMSVFRSLSDSMPAEPEADIVKKRLGPFFDYTPEAYYLADASGKFIDVNKAALELFGREKEDITGKSWERFAHITVEDIQMLEVETSDIQTMLHITIRIYFAQLCGISFNTNSLHELSPFRFSQFRVKFRLS